MKNENLDGVMFYYLRHEPKDGDEKGTPFGVVAVRENDDGTVNRGVSICSEIDAFNKKTGRGIAISRLFKAENECKNVNWFNSYFGLNQNCPIAFGEQNERDLFFTHKSMFHAPIEKHEHRMFHRPDEVK